MFSLILSKGPCQVFGVKDVASDEAHFLVVEIERTGFIRFERPAPLLTACVISEGKALREAKRACVRGVLLHRLTLRRVAAGEEA